MKKITTLITAGLFTVLSASAFACPKGTTLVGGTGPNHKGGKCVVATSATQAASKASTTATKAKADAAAGKDKAVANTKTVSEKPSQAKAKADTAAVAKADAEKAKTTTKDKAVKTAAANPLKP